MLKQKIGDLSARLLRAAVGRIATDLELARTIQAASSSATLIDLLMRNAKACSSRLDVMPHLSLHPLRTMVSCVNSACIVANH